MRLPRLLAVLALLGLAALARAAGDAPAPAMARSDSAKAAPAPAKATPSAAKATPDSSPATAAPGAKSAAAAAPDNGPFRIKIGSRLYPDWSEERLVGLDEPFFLGDTDLQATVERHFQDFKIKKGVPFDASTQPNNPALFILVKRDTVVVDSCWAFRNFPPHASPTSFFTFKLLDVEPESTKASSPAKVH